METSILPSSNSSSTLFSSPLPSISMVKNNESTHVKKKGSTREFPRKLYQLLEDAENLGFSDVVSWQGASSFRVHQPKKFQAEILSTYFRQSKYKSFLRQLNIYEFVRVQHGPNMGSYAHPFLNRGNPDLLNQMIRTTTNASSSKVQMPHKLPILQKTSQPVGDPCLAEFTTVQRSEENENSERLPSNLFDFKPLRDEQAVQHDDLLCHDFNFDLPETWESSLENVAACGLQDTDMGYLDSFSDAFSGIDDFFSPQKGIGQENSGNSMSTIISLEDMVQMVHSSCPEEDKEPIPFTSTVCSYGKGIGNASSEQRKSTYDDLSCSEAIFPAKLHRLLDDAELKDFGHVVSWINNGTAFKVHDIPVFVALVLPEYFNQSKYASFRRQLNLYDFRRESGGEGGTTCFSHPHFVKHDANLCRLIEKKR